MNRGLSPSEARPRLWALCVVALLAGVGLGVLLPVVSSVMKAGGRGELQIGAVAVGYFVAHGLSAWLSRGPQRKGWTQFTLTCGLALAATAAATFPLADRLGWWTANRMLAGLGMGAYMSAAQAVVLRLASSGSRGRVSAAYALCFGAGFALGPPIGIWSYALDRAIPFNLAAASLWLATLAAMLWARVGSARLEPAFGSRPSLTLLPHATVFAYAFAESTLFAMFPIFWLEDFGSVAGLGTALGLFVVGSLLAAVPVGWISDLVGRGWALGLCALAGAVSLLALPHLAPGVSRIVACLVTGATVGSTYPLALALLGDSGGDAADVSPAFTSAFSVGAIAGPFVTALAMHVFGHRAVFGPTAFVLVLLAACVALHGLVSRRAGAPRFSSPDWSSDHEKAAQ